MAGAPRPRAALTAEPVKEPWPQFGWVMAAVWLLFLAFPLVEAANLPVSPTMRVVAFTSIGVFVAAYLIGVRRSVSGAASPRFAGAALAVMVAAAVAAGAVIGLSAIGLPIYILSFAVFAFPLMTSLAITLTCVLVSVLWPLLAGQFREWYFMSVITIAVALALTASRVLGERADEAAQVRRDLEIMSERERVARDVHDVLGHTLTVLAAKTELAERLVDTDPARARTELAEIHALTREAIAEVRTTVGGLRARTLDDEVANARLALEAADIESVFEGDAAAVDARYRQLFAWILREGVTNVVRHSQARTCTVDLESDSITVTDDGRGLTAGYAEGNGLRGLRERVAEAGGALVVAAAPAGGTQLRVTMGPS